ncbi:Na+ dependent nucleoside transporter C-terminus-domain-containing protein [Aspergillus pseudoustus]|uniref:Na+ dependent nucleoside transporter C-terminus-domain-containing protein n=1 Tax=Aspergillus pseudoustus TaxID=1810923 RepID=A0ABR4K1G0_9EURO
MAKASDVFEGVSPKDTTTNTPEDPIRSSQPASSPAGSDDLSYSKEPYSEKRDIPDPHAADASSNPSGQDVEAGEGRFSGVKAQARHYKKHVILAVIWLLFTGWWIAGLILHRYDLGWLIPFLLYLAISLRVLFVYVPISIFWRPVQYVWKMTALKFVAMVPEPWRIPGGALVTIATIVVGSFASAEAPGNTREDRAVSLFGLVVCIFTLWLTSRNRRKIVWHTVIVGMLVQFIIALFVLRTTAGYDIFDFISMLARELLGFAQKGVDFLTTENFIATHGYFLVSVIPAIIFFVSLVQLLYYSGVLQWAIRKMAVFFFWSMRVSGAEAVVAAASPFIGQGESAMLIKPFIAHLTMAEIHQVMCSGFATIAGSVLVSYLQMGVNPQALISSCVMSIPASLAVSKLRWPEEEETLTAGRVIIPEDTDEKPSNILDAFAKGAWLGIKIAGMIAATLLCIISLIGLIDGLLTWWGRYLNINDPTLTLDLILGYICYPIAFLLGVSRNGDLLKVGKLIGLKLVANEFVAYSALQTDPQYDGLSTRSRLIATYALCGFANIGSLGNQIGVLAQLAPSRSGDVSRVAVSAMLTGAISTFTSATIAGMLIQNEQQFVSTTN